MQGLGGAGDDREGARRGVVRFAVLVLAATAVCAGLTVLHDALVLQPQVRARAPGGFQVLGGRGGAGVRPQRSSRPVSILVTGGAGFIGYHVASRLAARGDRPVVVVSTQQHNGENRLRKKRLRKGLASACKWCLRPANHWWWHLQPSSDAARRAGSREKKKKQRERKREKIACVLCRRVGLTWNWN